MKKLLLLSALFMFTGCSINQLFIKDEIDKVNIVKYTSTMKEHRAYFTREGLRPLLHKKKYLFLYHPKHHHLYVLFKKRDYYLLYNLSIPKREPQKLKASSTRKILHLLKKYGYQYPNDLKKLGFIVHTGLRRYKGVKTIMIDVKYYKSKTLKQKKALQKNTTNIEIDNTQKEDEHDLIQPLFPYYLQQASLTELEHYLSTDRSKELTQGERSLLEHRLENMRKQKLLQEASLETLIEEYKKNQDPEFKKHIQARIKELRSQ